MLPSRGKRAAGMNCKPIRESPTNPKMTESSRQNVRTGGRGASRITNNGEKTRTTKITIQMICFLFNFTVLLFVLIFIFTDCPAIVTQLHRIKQAELFTDTRGGKLELLPTLVYTNHVNRASRYSHKRNVIFRQRLRDLSRQGDRLT